MIYATKEQAAHEMVSGFNRIPTWLIEDSIKVCSEDWIICEKVEEWDDDEDDYVEFYTDYGNMPMWGWAFDPSGYLTYEWMDEHREPLMDIGFTIIENVDNGFWCLGIDGAGYDFYEAHWLPLYELTGFEWHEDE